jgi:primosomal protein N'
MPKIYNKYYMQIILKYKTIKQVYNALNNISEMSKKNNKVLVDIDFNPKKI